MPKKRLSMRKIREILRLKHACNCSNRKISRSCGIGRATVGDYLHRARAAGLDWPLPDELSDTVLEQRLFPSAAPRTTQARFIPDFQEVHKELQSRKHVTLNLLWQEYKEQHPDGYQYSWFCHSYRDWAAHLDVVMRRKRHINGIFFRPPRYVMMPSSTNDNQGGRHGNATQEQEKPSSALLAGS